MSEKTVDKMIFASRLRELIKTSGLTIQELGEKDKLMVESFVLLIK